MSRTLKILALSNLMTFSQAYAIVFNFEQTNNWGGGYQAIVTVTNDGSVDLEDWEVSFSLISQINSSWASDRTSSNFLDGLWNYTFSAFSYQSSTLGVGDSITIEYVAGAAPIDAEPTNVVIASSNNANTQVDNSNGGGDGNDTEPELPPSVDDFSVNYTTVNEWATGATIDVTITNNSGASINNWIVGFDLDRMVTNSWDTVQLTDDYDADYIFGAPSYAQTLADGASYTFGMNLGNGFGIYPENLRFLGANGVAAVPEVSSYAAIVGLCALLLVQVRRQRSQ